MPINKSNNMRITRIHIILTLTAGSLLLLHPLARAADPSESRPKATRKADRASAPARGANMMQRYTQQLNLTPDQQEKLQPILQQENEKRRELIGKSELSQEARREAMLKLRAETDQKVKNSKILTSEQWVKWQELRGTAGKKGGTKRNRQ